MKIPKQIQSGDSSSWIDLSTTDDLGNSIDSNAWTLKYTITGAGAPLTVTAATEGSGWKTSLSITQTGAWVAGTRYWQAYAEKGSERVTLGKGQLEILPNLSTAAADYDGRTQAQQDLAAVQTAIRALTSGGAVAEYTIGSRSIRKIPLTELITMEDRLKLQVSRERDASDLANGKPNPRKIKVRFQ